MYVVCSFGRIHHLDPFSSLHDPFSRYQITNTDFRLAAFGGYANLSGGSKGTQIGDREEDNGNYYSGGVGVRYTIQETGHRLQSRLCRHEHR